MSPAYSLFINDCYKVKFPRPFVLYLEFKKFHAGDVDTPQGIKNDLLNISSAFRYKF